MSETDNFVSDAWDELHGQARYRPRYPQDEVVRWAFSSFAPDRRKSMDVLDLGCGGGRHAVFLAREGFKTKASDQSSVGVEAAEKWSKAEGLDIEYSVCEATNLVYDDGAFDAVLCFGVLCYLDFDNLKKAVGEIRRVMRPGAKALVMTRTDRDFRANHAEKTGPATYIIGSDGSAEYPALAEVGMLHCFLSEADVRSAFVEFSELEINRSAISVNDGAYSNDEWLIKVSRS
jgi:SAM-dependent methyltransferase